MRKIDVTQYKEGTPEFILANFYFHWQKHDYGSMLEFCQKYWLEGAEKPLDDLRERFKNFDLVELLYIEKSPTNETNGLNENVVIDLLALVVISSGKISAKKKLIPRLLCENENCRPTLWTGLKEGGTWGVNPISALKTLKKVKV